MPIETLHKLDKKLFTPNPLDVIKYLKYQYPRDKKIQTPNQ